MEASDAVRKDMHADTEATAAVVGVVVALLFRLKWNENRGRVSLSCCTYCVHGHTHLHTCVGHAPAAAGAKRRGMGRPGVAEGWHGSGQGWGSITRMFQLHLPVVHVTNDDPCSVWA